jgi:hypothetical protein
MLTKALRDRARYLDWKDKGEKYLTLKKFRMEVIVEEHINQG